MEWRHWQHLAQLARTLSEFGIETLTFCTCDVNLKHMVHHALLFMMQAYPSWSAAIMLLQSQDCHFGSSGIVSNPAL